jgi:hypothetical protein
LPVAEGVCGAKLRTMSLTWASAVRSGGSAALVDRPGDGLSTVNPGAHIDHFAGIVQRRAEKTASMRVMIAERFILAQDRTRVLDGRVG